MTLKDRIIQDLINGDFEEGTTTEIADHYGVKTATAYKAMRSLGRYFLVANLTDNMSSQSNLCYWAPYDERVEEMKDELSGKSS